MTREYRSAAIMVTILMGVASCGAPEQTGEISATHSQLFTDPTGNITISINQCAAQGFPGGFGTLSCPVQDTFVLVGGGGQVVGETVPGAFLQMSEPIAQTWFVRAKDHVEPTSYQLQGAAIGLKLNGVTQSALASMVTVTHTDINSGTPSHAPQVVIAPPPNSVVLGGGAVVGHVGGQQMLTASFPAFSGTNTPTGWIAGSKDHEISYLDTVLAYVISIPQCPPGFAGGCLTSTAPSFQSSTGGGYRSATNQTTGAVSGVGGMTFYHADAGRLLTAIWPTDVHAGGESTLLVDSTDHDIPDSGLTVGYQVILSVR